MESVDEEREDMESTEEKEEEKTQGKDKRPSIRQYYSRTCRDKDKRHEQEGHNPHTGKRDKMQRGARGGDDRAYLAHHSTHEATIKHAPPAPQHPTVHAVLSGPPRLFHLFFLTRFPKHPPASGPLSATLKGEDTRSLPTNTTHKHKLQGPGGQGGHHKGGGVQAQL